MNRWYKMHDANPAGMIEIRPSHAKAENEKGFGIFWSINSFRGARQIKNLNRIVSWAVDLDTGTKAEMVQKIESGLPPTMVVESKRGFHVYWKAVNAKPEHWNAIMLDRLVPFYGADKNARDLARVLRVPGFFHMKNPAEPFLISKVWEYKTQYTEKDLVYFYPDKSEPERKEHRERSRKESGVGSGELWDAVFRMDCAEALERISGISEIGGEVFTFKQNRTGTLNIYANGNSTSAWVDRDGRIGSSSKGGPTIAQWLRWYGLTWPQTVAVMKNHFPELPWDKK